MTKIQTPIAATVLSPGQRFATWVQEPQNPYYYANKLPELERLAKEVFGSTFHLHGSVKPEDITRNYIKHTVESILNNLERAPLDFTGKQKIRERVRQARADLSLYAAERALDLLTKPKRALERGKIEEISEEAKQLFEQSRDRADIPRIAQANLAHNNQRQIELARRHAFDHSIKKDITDLETGPELSDIERAVKLERATANIAALERTEASAAYLARVEGLRENLAMAHELSFLPLSKKVPSNLSTADRIDKNLSTRTANGFYIN